MKSNLHFTINKSSEAHSESLNSCHLSSGGTFMEKIYVKWLKKRCINVTKKIKKVNKIVAIKIELW